MAKVGAKRAAELTGKSKSTIQRAMKSGKVSYEVLDNNRRVVDVSELERVLVLMMLRQEQHQAQQRPIQSKQNCKKPKTSWKWSV
ncbi:MAG: hypothetical protein CMH28_09190 [Micavibrio sp.]|nr:hypothetical protein [Micavibrio sp.]